MKRLLVITTTFYPDPQVGAVRMTQWCRHLPEHGWAPTVLTRHYGFEATPPQLAEHVHPDVRVEYLTPPPPAPATAPPPQRSARHLARQLAVRFAGPLLIPDTSIRFWRSARQRALRHVEALRPDVILSTSPTHATHDLGMWLSQEARVPWVADYRDVHLLDFTWKYGWASRLMFSRHRRFERSVYEHASLIIHAIPVHARWASRFYPVARGRIRTLPNGAPARLAEGRVEPVRTDGGRRSVRAIGSIGDDDVARLAAAVKQLSGEGLDLELCFVGKPPGNGETLRRALGERLRTTGYVSHDEALREVVGADVLISCLSGGRQRYGLSSKLYEFLAAGRPILEINPSIPDRQLLRRIPGVQILERPTPDELAVALRRALATHGLPPEVVERFRNEFNRAHQVQRLACWLDELVAR